MQLSLFQQKPRLYAIDDYNTCEQHGITTIDFARAFFDAGGGILQYRNKSGPENSFAAEAHEIDNLARQYGAVLIINDRTDIACNLKRPVHLGQEDALNRVGISTPYGYSTHNAHEVENALKMTPLPDYIGYGTMFNSQTKPDITVARQRLSGDTRKWQGDIVLIGGIDKTNLNQLPSQNHFYYAVIRGFFDNFSKLSDIEKNTRHMLKTIEN